MSDRIVTPIRSTHPTRRPYVRDTTFIDSRPGPPFAFFDETQDHLGAAFHAALGWRWSVSREDFDRTSYPAGMLGVLRILRNQTAPGGLVFTEATPSIPGEYGVWQGLCGATPNNQFDVELEDVACQVSGDYLVSAKLAPIGVARLDLATDEGLHVGVSSKAVGGPAFAAGSTGSTALPTWWTFYRGRTPQYQDSGIPCLESAYYTLQISRVAGAIRWFINGYPLSFSDGSTGIYAPETVPLARYMRIKRWNAGATGDGFRIDHFHRLAQRE